ncbi:MAG: GNAT family N-acetyltransferase, partial [Acidimicrobiales bacterium]
MTMAVSIAIATAADAEEVAAALEHLVPQLSRSNPPPSLDAVRAMLAHDAVTQFLARGDEGTIVGVATIA